MVSHLRADLHAKAVASAHPGRHSESPEPVTSSGVRLGQALYDGEPPLVDGPRPRRSTERGQVQIDTMRALNQKRAGREASQQNQPTDSERHGRSTDIRPLGQSNTGTSSGRRGQSTDIHQLRQPNANTKPNSKSKSRKPRPQSQSGHRVRLRETDAKADEEQQQRKRKSDLKRITRSPTPGSTDAEPDEPSQYPNAQQSTESQYTYVWNEVGYESLVDYAGARLGYKVQGWTEDQILEKLDKIEYIEGYQTHKKAPLGNPGNHSSTVVLPPTPIAVGGGWHRDNDPAPRPASIQPMASRPAKRPVDMADTATVKRMRLADPDNTDTEPESDEEPVLASTGPRPPPAPPAPPAVRAEPSQPPTATLTRQSTSTTVPETPLEGQSTGSPSLGGSVSRFSPLPQLMPPIMNVPRGPVHARLQANVVARNTLMDLATVALDGDVEMGDPETQQETPTARVPPTTYIGYRSHVGSPDDTSVPRTPPPTRANSPAPAPAQRQPKRPRAPSNSVLAHLERLQMADSVRDAIRAGRAEATSRSRIRRVKPSAPPKTATQPSSSAASKKSSRRLEPIPAARADMVEFNERCAREHVTSFVQSVTRQNERRGRCTLREGEGRPPQELLPDNEEDLAHDEALRQGKQPPLARDFSGIRRQILTLAKIHLFAFALSEGIYQTRATFMMWAALVHEATWRMELPDVPYVAATTEELEVMVNYLATLRGKVKERIRPIVSSSRGFNHCVATQQDIQDNLDLFHEVYPNSFHCTSTRPRRGHYEHIDVARCIAASFFYGPNAVGVLFPDYFEDMPLTIVAFILAIMQFCIEEWSNGYFTSHDLGAANMLDKYEAHLAGLKELRKIAPKRLQRMQDGWFEYASEYSGACFIREKCDQECTPREELRPDTPPPPPPPRQSSSQGSSQGSSRSGTSVRALAPTSSYVEDDDLYETPDLGPNPFFIDDQRAPTPSDVESRAPTPPPPAEYNEHGCQTARSKGKGRARD
ncbi:hypothetical protein FRC08_010852 [Ceratobasidium sp. 394]|nr:hypothetical protein FRC08_010852 [Ceratobasidium sp. 394]